MSILGSHFKKFDIHVKLVDGVSQQTTLGAIITIICVVLTVLLSYSELNLLLRPEQFSHVVLDQTSTEESVKLNFDVEFHKLKCQYITFSQEVVRGTVHKFLEAEKDNSLELSNSDDGLGCRVKGRVITDKVTGNFKFKVLPTHSNSDDFFVNLVAHYPNLDLSHTVHNIYFQGQNDIVSQLLGNLASPPTPLKSQVTKLNDGSSGLYVYNLQIVPSKRKRNGKVEAANLNKYSVSEKKIELSDLNQGLSFGGTTVQNFVGVIVTYEFYPVAVIYESNNEGILQFFVSLCAIIGGLVTVLSLVDKCMYRSVKAIIGKKD